MKDRKAETLDNRSPDAVVQPELFPLVPVSLAERLERLPVIRGNVGKQAAPEARPDRETRRSGAA